MGKKKKRISESDRLFFHMCKPRNWWEQYCAHVLEPGQYIFVSAMLLVFFVSFGILMFVMTSPLQLEKLDRFETAFVDYTVDEDNGIVTFRSDKSEGKFALATDRDDLKETVIRICGTGAVYTVYGEYYEKEDQYNIAALMAPNGSVLLSLEETNAAIRTERILGLAMTAIFLLLWAVFTFGLFYVGAYPEQHPWLVRLFYKKNAIYY